MAKTTGRRRASRKPLSRAKVLRAAIRLADKNGIDSLSMRRLAQKVGVEAMSLYNHVANKEDLLDGMVEVVAAEIEVPEIGGDWKATMRRRGLSAREVLLRHPWATMLIVSRVNVGPAMLRYVNATIGCLREAGFSYALADHSWNAIDSYVYGFVLQELNFPFQPEEYSETAADYLEATPMDDYPFLAALATEVAAGRHSGVHELTLGLDLLIDGLERLRDG